MGCVVSLQVQLNRRSTFDLKWICDPPTHHIVINITVVCRCCWPTSNRCWGSQFWGQWLLCSRAIGALLATAVKLATERWGRVESRPQYWWWWVLWKWILKKWKELFSWQGGGVSDAQRPGRSKKVEHLFRVAFLSTGRRGDSCRFCCFN